MQFRRDAAFSHLKYTTGDTICHHSAITNSCEKTQKKHAGLLGFFCKSKALLFLQSQRAQSSRATPRDSWGHLKMTLEGPTECSFRTVPESISCLTRAHALLTNPASSEGHPPPCHILHRGDPYQSRESLSKDGARKVDFPREGSNGPGFLSATMDHRERMPNIRITQRSQPTEPSVLVSLHPCSDSLDDVSSSRVRPLKPTTSTDQGQISSC